MCQGRWVAHRLGDREHDVAADGLIGKGGRRVDEATLITLGHWEVGLVVGKGNPKGIRRASDVRRRGLRLVNREKGASPRLVLERRLKAEGVLQPADPATVRGHRDVARVIASGAADVGPAVRDVAISFGLDFVSFAEERFDLALSAEMLSSPRVQRMLDTLTSARVRAELSALGYDTRETGNRVALPA
jgi:putative molybdopterin biosynthesis protein